ncbi:MAG: hypothetical protein HY924_02120 [Elusimicrobia bacterium]|nr:hypothetical protein [Elusimicrobiota bacterium]
MTGKPQDEDLDPENAELGRRLAELDFSTETSMREPLRKRLMERADALSAASWRQRWVPVFAPAFAMAALVLALFVGLPPGPERGPELQLGLDRVLVRPPMVGDKALVPEAVGMVGADLPAVTFGAASGLDRMTAEDLMETVQGQEVVSEKGRSVRWRVGDDVFILESRETTLEELGGLTGNGID